MSFRWSGFGLLVFLFFLGILVFNVNSIDAVESGTAEGIIVGLVEDDLKTGTSKETFYVQEITRAGINTRQIQNVDSEQIQATSMSVLGPKKVAVILANFSDYNSSPISTGQVDSILSNELSAFMAEMSYGKTTFSFDVLNDWVTMNSLVTCDKNTITEESLRAADEYINYNDYNYVLIVFPNNGCQFSGFGYYPPGYIFESNEGQKTLPISVIPDDYMLNWGLEMGAHELGHNLGLRHANGIECGNVSFSSWCFNNLYNPTNYRSVEYGDWFDIMGGGLFNYTAHYNAYYKEFLGWISNANTKVVTTTGNYSISRLESDTSQTFSLKIPMEGTNNYLEVENRDLYGFDSGLPESAVSGALLRIVPRTLGGYTSDTSHIIDSTPNSKEHDDFNDGGFRLGSMFRDANRGFKIEPITKNDGVLGVKVTFFSPGLMFPVNSNIDVNLRPKFDWNDIGQSRSYTLQVATQPTFATRSLVNLGISTSALTTSEFSPPVDLPRGTKFYWRVRANYSFGSGDWSSPSWSFTTLNYPAPYLIYPTNSSTSVNILRPTYDWYDATGATSYVINVSLDSNFSTLLQSAQVTNGSNYTAINFPPRNTQIYWRVRALYQANTSGWSETFSYISPNPPTPPTLVSPLNSSVVTSLRPSFRWNLSTYGTVSRYHLKVSEFSDFSTFTISESNIGPTATSYTHNINFKPRTLYYWRMHAINSNNEISPGSEIGTFRTP